MINATIYNTVVCIHLLDDISDKTGKELKDI